MMMMRRRRALAQSPPPPPAPAPRAEGSCATPASCGFGGGGGGGARATDAGATGRVLRRTGPMGAAANNRCGLGRPRRPLHGTQQQQQQQHTGVVSPLAAISTTVPMAVSTAAGAAVKAGARFGASGRAVGMFKKQLLQPHRRAPPESGRPVGLQPSPSADAPLQTVRRSERLSQRSSDAEEVKEDEEEEEEVKEKSVREDKDHTRGSSVLKLGSRKRPRVPTHTNVGCSASRDIHDGEENVQCQEQSLYHHHDHHPHHDHHCPHRAEQANGVRQRVAKRMRVQRTVLDPSDSIEREQQQRERLSQDSASSVSGRSTRSSARLRTKRVVAARRSSTVERAPVGPARQSSTKTVVRSPTPKPKSKPKARPQPKPKPKAKPTPKAKHTPKPKAKVKAKAKTKANSKAKSGRAPPRRRSRRGSGRTVVLDSLELAPRAPRSKACSASSSGGSSGSKSPPKKHKQNALPRAVFRREIIEVGQERLSTEHWDDAMRDAATRVFGPDVDLEPHRPHATAAAVAAVAAAGPTGAVRTGAASSASPTSTAAATTPAVESAGGADATVLDLAMEQNETIHQPKNNRSALATTTTTSKTEVDRATVTTDPVAHSTTIAVTRIARTVEQEDDQKTVLVRNVLDADARSRSCAAAVRWGANRRATADAGAEADHLQGEEQENKGDNDADEAEPSGIMVFSESQDSTMSSLSSLSLSQSQSQSQSETQSSLTVSFSVLKSQAVVDETHMLAMDMSGTQTTTSSESCSESCVDMERTTPDLDGAAAAVTAAAATAGATAEPMTEVFPSAPGAAAPAQDLGWADWDGECGLDNQERQRHRTQAQIVHELRAAAAPPTCPYPRQRARLCWYCEAKHSYQILLKRAVLAPFRKDCGFRTINVPKDGDCFYRCVLEALGTLPDSPVANLNVQTLRGWVADALTEDQLEFYKIHAQANPRDKWLDFARPGTKRTVQNIEELRAFVRLEGSVVGDEACLWADEFAFREISRRLDLCVLFIDMERARGSWPYRTLSTCGQPRFFITLKRIGPVGHFLYLSDCDGRAAYTEDGLPDVIQTLWALDQDPHVRDRDDVSVC